MYQVLYYFVLTLTDRDDVHMDQIWLESVSRAAMYSYCEEILHIHEISEHAAKQLVTDIGKTELLWSHKHLKIQLIQLVTCSKHVYL